MKIALLDILRCPYCGSEFVVKNNYQGSKNEINNGELKCECNHYPVLDGILNLRGMHSEQHVLNLLNKGKAESALPFLLTEHIEALSQFASFLKSKSIFSSVFSQPLKALLSYLFWRNDSKYINTKSSFIRLLGNSSWELYLKHRFIEQSMWSFYPFLHLLKKNKGIVLDLGCGTGHASFLIRGHVQPNELICVDHNFKNLYLAKNYIVDDAQFICLDSNSPLPFKDNVYDSILLLDALHYVKNRLLLASEIERILSPSGFFMILHLHNSMKNNLSAGQPMKPLSWCRLFEHSFIKAFPEKRLVEDFIYRDKLDLTMDYSESELNEADAISIIGTDNAKPLFNVFEGVLSEFIQQRSNLIINPIYKLYRKKDKILLRRGSLAENFRKEYPVTVDYLPEQCFVPFLAVDSNGGKVVKEKLMETNLEELMRRFIIINVPHHYI